MLVISQKVGDIIKLGSDITVKVIDIKGGKVRLGIEARYLAGSSIFAARFFIISCFTFSI